MKFLSILFFTILLSTSLFGQDLNARVQILSPQIQNTNKRPLEALQEAMNSFLNNRKWSNDEVKGNEKIDCNFVITIREWDGSSSFKAEAQIVSSRPVFNASYNSTLLNINDKNFDFNYSEGQPLEFSEQNFQNNISSLLAFYAFIIVGLDYDSFANLGGTPYFTKAQNIVNYSQSAGFSGWQAQENFRNRYWIVENLMNKSFLPLRELVYNYHRQGLDILVDNTIEGKKNIIAALSKLNELDRQRQSTILIQTFFSAKADEISNIFSKSAATDKLKIYNLMTTVDPANTRKYEVLKKN